MSFNLKSQEISGRYPAWKGWCFALAASVSSGYFVIAFRNLSEAAGHSAGLFVTMFSCLLFYTAGVLIQQGKGARISKRTPILIIIVAMTIIGNLAAIIGLDYLLPAVFQVIQRTEILFTIFLGALFLGERIRPMLYLIAMLVIAGIVMINYEQSGGLSNWSGVILAIASGLCFAVLQVCSKIILQDFTPIMLNFIRMAATCLLLAVIFPNVLMNLDEISHEAWLWGILSAFCGPFMGRLFYTYSISYIEVSKAAIVTSLSPIFSLGFQWWLIGQGVSPLQALGGTVIIISVCTVFYVSQKEIKHPVASAGKESNPKG